MFGSTKYFKQGRLWFLSNTSLLFSFRHNPLGTGSLLLTLVFLPQYRVLGLDKSSFRCTCCEPTASVCILDVRRLRVISNLQKWSFGKTGFENWLYPQKSNDVLIENIFSNRVICEIMASANIPTHFQSRTEHGNNVDQDARAQKELH